MDAALQLLSTVGHGALLVLVLAAQVAGALMLFVGLPGTWITLAAIAAYGALTGFHAVSVTLVLALLVLAVLGEVLEFGASAIGAQRFGASRGGVIGAVVGVFPGVVLGTMLLPIIGTVVGAFAGAFLGAFLWELSQHRPPNEAIRAGLGAMLGRTGAVIAKLLVALTMSGTFVAALLQAPPAA